MKSYEMQLHDLNRFFESVIGKSWFEAWTLDDVRYLVQAARSCPPCETCKGTGYQDLVGYPGAKGGCDDCYGTGCNLGTTDKEIKT